MQYITPVDKLSVLYARIKLDAAFEEVSSLLADKILGRQNLSRQEKTLVASLYRGWIDDLQVDSQFGMIKNDKYEDDRVYTHNTIVETLRGIGCSSAPHILKNMQDDFTQLSVPGYQVGSVYLPMEKGTSYNSGDTIFCFELDSGIQHLGIADVAGKSSGIKDALDTKSYLLMLADSCNGNLPLFYTKLNNQLCERYKDDEKIYGNPRYVTAVSVFLPKITKQTNSPKHVKFEAITAGHEPPIIYRAKTSTFSTINQTNMFLGMFSSTEELNKYTENKVKESASLDYKSGSYVLNKGDILVLYSDGLTDSRDMNERPLGVIGLKKLIKKNQNKSAQEIADSVPVELAALTQGKRYDDISVVVVKYVGV